MKFIQNVEMSKYREFENKHKKSHFLQSYEWGQFCKRARRQIPRYVGMEDNDGRKGRFWHEFRQRFFVILDTL